jgi:hypothetical protein
MSSTEFDLQPSAEGPFLELELHDAVITVQSGRLLVEAIVAGCKQHGLNKVLLTSHNPDRRLDTFSAYDVACHVESLGAPGLYVAIVIPGQPLDEISQFIETVSYNRGAHVKYCQDRSDALRWLGIKDDAGERTRKT